MLGSSPLRVGWGLVLVAALFSLGCGPSDEDASDDGAAGGGQGGGTGGTSQGGGGTGGASGGSGGSAGSAGQSGSGATDPGGGPPAGNPDGHCDIPAEAALEDTSTSDHVVGDGTVGSCTSQAFVDAVALGGVITFDCGPAPVTITLDRTAKIFNDTGPRIVIDGGGKVTLSGGGSTRILYMNTCDEAQHFTTDHCQDQDHPQLTVQNLTFVDGNSTGELEEDGGGGAILVRGGRFKIVSSRFFSNVCDPEGPDLGGAAVRAFSQFDGNPVHVVNSTFGGAPELGGSCSNGGGVSSIGVSWTILNSLFSYNHAIGNGGNPAEAGTPGGGSGGAIYNDGNTMTLHLCGTLIESNVVNAYGSAIFFVSNDHSGNIVIEDSVIRNNMGGSWYARPGISMHEDTRIDITNSTLE
ncbi:MAG TPA: hypothetical protein VF103_13845 [Polyangiaceae bacterium]